MGKNKQKLAKVGESLPKQGQKREKFGENQGKIRGKILVISSICLTQVQKIFLYKFLSKNFLLRQQWGSRILEIGDYRIIKGEVRRDELYHIPTSYRYVQLVFIYKNSWIFVLIKEDSISKKNIRCAGNREIYSRRNHMEKMRNVREMERKE